MTLEPGSSTTVVLELDGRAFARWASPDPDLAEVLGSVTAHVPWTSTPEGADEKGWVIDPGPYELRIGRSSADIVDVVSVDAPARGTLVEL